MKFKHTLKNYATLLVEPVLNIPIALFVISTHYIADLGNWIEDNTFDKLPKLDMDYSEDIAKKKKDVMDGYFKLANKQNVKEN